MLPFLGIPDIILFSRYWQKEDKLAWLLDEIGCEQGAKIHVFVDFKIKADELTRYVGAFLPKCESDGFQTIRQSHDIRLLYMILGKLLILGRVQLATQSSRKQQYTYFS